MADFTKVCGSTSSAEPKNSDAKMKKIGRKKGCIPWNKGKICPQLTGKNNGHWIKGEIIDKAGYVLIYAPYHPYAVQRYVRKHRLIMEKHIKRFLLPSEIVHHKNKNLHDNRFRNLKLLENQKQHAKMEDILRKRDFLGRYASSF